jgi:uncharacterized protein (DUF305 family)
MPYNAETIEKFIKMVNKEAQEAAQKVFNKYQEEFDRRVLAQMIEGHTLIVAMGSAVIKEEEDVDYARKFCNAVAEIQYTKQRAGFSTKDYQKNEQP